MSRKALGRGLNALIPDFDLDESLEEQEGMLELPIEEIEPGPLQPRKQFDPEALEGLTESIRENGVVQPIIVQMGQKNKYEIICGERRWRASQKAGLKKIPVVVREVTSTEQLQMALIENIHRQDLNPIEEAKAYARLGQEFGLTQEAIAQKVGKNRASVANHLRLLKLSRQAQDDLVSGQLTFGHARAMLGVEEEKNREALRLEIIKKGLNVREAEAWVTQHGRRESTTTTTGQQKKKDVFLSDLEQQFERALGTKVEIKAKKKGGQISVTYYSNDDLSRIRDMILKTR